jgi:hypothetical protein
VLELVDDPGLNRAAERGKSDPASLESMTKLSRQITEEHLDERRRSADPHRPRRIEDRAAERGTSRAYACQ